MNFTAYMNVMLFPVWRIGVCGRGARLTSTTRGMLSTGFRGHNWKKLHTQPGKENG